MSMNNVSTAKEDVKLCPGDCLVVVDMQEDFMEDGSLPVEGARALVEPLNEVIELFGKNCLPIVFSRDWHPEDHCSFKSQGGQWPEHCVQNSTGAMFSRGLHLPDDAIVVSKGTSREKDAYSAFKGTNLSEKLREKGVKRIFVGGVATDYCVRETVLDGLNLGFRVFLLTDCTAPVTVEGGRKAQREMEQAGAQLLEASVLG